MRAAAIEYELFETTDMVDADSLAALDSASDDLATIHFASSTPILARVAAGRVLLGGPTEDAQRGVCRHGTSVERSGDTRLVHGTPATVFHAFRHPHVEVTGNVGDALALSRRAMQLRDELGSIEEDEGEVFLTLAQTLIASGRLDEARSVASQGLARLDALAARIEDPEWRARFLTNVAAHADLRGLASSR